VSGLSETPPALLSHELAFPYGAGRAVPRTGATGPRMGAWRDTVPRRTWRAPRHRPGGGPQLTSCLHGRSAGGCCGVGLGCARTMSRHPWPWSPSPAH